MPSMSVPNSKARAADRADARSRDGSEHTRLGRVLDPVALQRTAAEKYGDPPRGWAPAMRRWFGYYQPNDVYESVVERLIRSGCRWLDVGCGRDVFPMNRPLARKLSERCGTLVGVDPDVTIRENPFVHVRIQGQIEDVDTNEAFDVITARMVVEHVRNTQAFASSLRRLCGPHGAVVIYTVNKWAPVSMASWLIPFSLHHRIKSFLWRTSEEDTFPVEYRMNTQRELTTLMRQAGFEEWHFEFLDDCRTFGRFRLGSLLELLVWKALNTMGLHYPETCLLGIYRRADQ